MKVRIKGDIRLRREDILRRIGSGKKGKKRS